MEVVEDFDPRPHRAVSLLVESEKKEMQEWSEQKLPKVLPGYSGGRLPGRSAKEKGREEGEEKASDDREIRQEIAQEVVAGIKEKASAHDDAKVIAKKRMTGQRKTRRKYNGIRMRSLRRLWNNEGWKEAPCSWK